MAKGKPALVSLQITTHCMNRVKEGIDGRTFMTRNFQKQLLFGNQPLNGCYTFHNKQQPSGLFFSLYSVVHRNAKLTREADLSLYSSELICLQSSPALIPCLESSSLNINVALLDLIQRLSPSLFFSLLL